MKKLQKYQSGGNFTNIIFNLAEEEFDYSGMGRREKKSELRANFASSGKETCDSVANDH
jgi:hypothetical protein